MLDRILPFLFSLAFACTSQALADRTLVSEAVIAAPVADVWKAFTTSEGFASWAVAHAEIDLRIGGDMRTHYNPKGVLGDEGTIINRVIAFEPERMLSIQNVQAPKGFPNADLLQQTWSVIYFEPENGQRDRTRVRCVGLGYGEGPAWDDLYNKFKAGNAYTLERLRKKFEPNAMTDDPQRVITLLGKLAGGEWIHEGHAPGSPEGSVFRVRNVITFAPDGKSMTSRGWLGGEAGMHEHSVAVVWLEPGESGTPGEVRFQNINEQGTIARGAIHSIGCDSVEWDWRETAADGSVSRARVTMAIMPDGRYTMKTDQIGDDGAVTPIVQADFKRVDKAPEEFLRMQRN